MHSVISSTKWSGIEEDRFGNTVTVGLGKLNDLGINAETAKDEALFLSIGKLYDTFRTPRDLIRVYLEEKGLEFEEEDFNQRFDNALQELQKQGDVGHTTRKSQPSPIYSEILEKVGANQFHGYNMTQLADARVVAILDGEKPVDELSAGAQGSVVLDNTPFYAESGGQIGDTGVIVKTTFGKGDKTAVVETGGVASKATVSDTYSPVQGLIIHKVTVQSGSLKVGDEVVATVDVEKRDATRRNHTATHLVHAALREVLGNAC